MGFSTHLDPARFISIGLNDVRVGDQLFGNVRIADVLAALAKFKSSAPRYKRTPEPNPSINGKPSDKITMDALYPRYAKFIRSGDNVVLESGSSSFGVPPMTLADDVQVQIQMLWGSIGWATGAAFGIALADPKRKTILITGEGSHQLTANEIGNMGRFGANPIILCLNNDGYMVERALEPNPDWSYNDLAKWRYADVPHALGCTDWFTARVETLGELDAALKAARESKSGAYIEVIGGRMDMPKGLSFAHTRLKELCGPSGLTKQQTTRRRNSYVRSNFGIATETAHKIDNCKQHENCRARPSNGFARFQQARRRSPRLLLVRRNSFGGMAR